MIFEFLNPCTCEWSILQWSIHVSIVAIMKLPDLLSPGLAGHDQNSQSKLLYQLTSLSTPFLHVTSTQFIIKIVFSWGGGGGREIYWPHEMEPWFKYRYSAPLAVSVATWSDAMVSFLLNIW